MAPGNTSGGEPQGSPPDYEKLSEGDLVKEVETRISAGRELDLDDTSPAGLIAALRGDDDAVAAEANAAKANATPPAEAAPAENTSGRPELAELAAERADNRNPRVIKTDVREED